MRKFIFCQLLLTVSASAALQPPGALTVTSATNKEVQLAMFLSFQVGSYPFDPTSPAELAAGIYFWRGPVGFQFPRPLSQ